MNRFAVVEFTEESSVGIVPLSWLKNQHAVYVYLYILCQKQEDIEELLCILLM